MTEQKALSYVNMYGVLGSLEDLCRIDEEAKRILKEMKSSVSLCFEVKDGPTATFTFSEEGCSMRGGDAGADAKMHFASPEKFNLLISDAKPGIPVRGIAKTLAFLLGPFTKLTDRLNAVLRATEDDLKDPVIFEENTLLTLYVIAGAVPALANYDSISRVSASSMPDGEVEISIPGKAEVTIISKNCRLRARKGPSKNPRATMSFADIELAHNVFNGKAATIAELCKGNIRIAGMINMIDNINRILDRVSVYLA